MDGLSHIAGKRTATFEVDGKTYVLKPKILDEYAEREQYILSLKPHPLTLLDQLPPLPPTPKMPVPPDDLKDTAAMAKYHAALTVYQSEKAQHDAAVTRREKLEESLRKEAMRPQVVSFEDEAAFDRSLHGIAFKLWRALRENHPEINSVQAALNLLEKIGDNRLSEINNKLDLADEKDLLGNSSGSEERPPGPVEPRGAGSTVPLHDATAGPSQTSGV